jgi:hypothetical protein
MIFGFDYRKSAETILVTQTDPVEFNRGMPKYAVSLFAFVITGTDNALDGAGVDRYELNLDNDLVVSIKPEELRALFEYIYSRMGGEVPAAASLAWHIPWYLLGMLAPKIDNGNYPEVGLPAGTDKVWRVNLNAASDAGSYRIGWKKSAKAPTHSPLIVGRAVSGLAASSLDETYEINWQAFPTVGMIVNGFSHFDRIRVFAADSKGFTTQLCDITPTMLLELLDPYNVQSITDPVFIPFDVPTVFGKDSYILLDTKNTYDGSERIVPVQLVEEKQG